MSLPTTLMATARPAGESLRLGAHNASAQNQMASLSSEHLSFDTISVIGLGYIGLPTAASSLGAGTR